MTISNSNYFDLFSYGSESVFCYFQCQWLISDFSDNPLKLNKISCKVLKFAQSETYYIPFSKKWKFVGFSVNGTSFLQDSQRKRSKKKVAFQRLISDFSDNPLKLHQISGLGPPDLIREFCLPFCAKKEKCPLLVRMVPHFYKIFKGKNANQFEKKKKKKW